MNPVSITHPAAATPAPEGKTPRYLVRKDGVVLLYHPALARLGTFEPAEVLPEWHVRKVAAAAQAEEELRRVREARNGVEVESQGKAAGASPAAIEKGTAAAGGRLDSGPSTKLGTGLRRNDGSRGAARKQSQGRR